MATSNELSRFVFLTMFLLSASVGVVAGTIKFDKKYYLKGATGSLTISPGYIPATLQFAGPVEKLNDTTFKIKNDAAPGGISVMCSFKGDPTGPGGEIGDQTSDSDSATVFDVKLSKTLEKIAADPNFISTTNLEIEYKFEPTAAAPDGYTWEVKAATITKLKMKAQNIASPGDDKVAKKLTFKPLCAADTPTKSSSAYNYRPDWLKYDLSFKYGSQPPIKFTIQQDDRNTCRQEYSFVGITSGIPEYDDFDMSTYSADFPLASKVNDGDYTFALFYIVENLIMIKNDYGKAMPPTSGFRTPFSNLRIKDYNGNKNTQGAITSQHMFGNAIDIEMKDDAEWFILAIIAFDYYGANVEPRKRTSTWCHLDWRSSDPPWGRPVKP